MVNCNKNNNNNDNKNNKDGGFEFRSFNGVLHGEKT